ncbi:LapA family protein [Enterococcus sp. CSURQ0835]|uniref:LapA family protein n=1 Tax=Enterococcus sp. CSURQ0835 TaxID=2681394 RepID=UPI001359209D|nr:lipopolysaccharide assembly protein LapA domain-containing protein [Enterococcus sp. CSURQ0835]
MKTQWKVIVGFILVLIIVIFAVMNNQAVPVNFGFAEVSGPLIIIIIGAALVGALVVFLTSSTTLFQQKKKIKQLDKLIASYEADNEQKLADEKERMRREQENELATVKANYETALKEKEQQLEKLQPAAQVDTPVENELLTPAEPPKQPAPKDQKPLDYYD